MKTGQAEPENKTGDGHHSRPVLFDERDQTLLKIVNHVSRQNIGRCFHCLTCSGGCPFSAHMDILPNQVIRLVQLGQKREALNCRTIWVCVGCHTCSSQCPTAVDMAAVMDVLRQLALREGITPPETDILNFHRHIYQSIRAHGKLHKLESLINFKLSTGRWFEDLNIGMKLMVKGKLDLRASTVKNKDEVERIFNYYEQRRESFTSGD